VRLRHAAEKALTEALLGAKSQADAIKALRLVGAQFRPEHFSSWDAFRYGAVKALEPFCDGEAKPMAWATLEGDFGELSGRELQKSTPAELQQPDTGFPRALPASAIGDLEPPGFHVDGLVLEDEINFTTGDGGAMKTLETLAISVAVAGGYPAFGRFKVRQTPVLIISEEDPGEVIGNRLRALVEGYGWDPALLANVHVLAREGVTLEDSGWQAHIRAEIERTGAGLVVLDPWAELTRGKENANDDQKPNIRFMRSLNREGVTVLAVHHAGKAYEGQRALDRSLRGASALNAAARSIFLLERTELGVAVKCLKMSRAEKPSPFVLEAHIESDPDKRTVWRSARLTYLEQHEADANTAEAFVETNLGQYGTLNSSALKELAKGSGLRAVDVSAAIKTLETVNRIAFEPGARGAKNWYLTGAALEVL